MDAKSRIYLDQYLNSLPDKAAEKVRFVLELRLVRLGAAECFLSISRALVAQST